MIGEVVGNYRIVSQIGSGGMGAVYEAHHELLGKTAAIKVLLPERSANREIVQRFFNEARAVSTVQHPGIPEIFDFGHLPSGNAYIIMELLEGETLGERLKREQRMSVKAAVSTARHIAGVLGAAHSHGIVHRDLKPDNVFLVPDPALPRGERAKILDFGIAKLVDSDRPSAVHTETGRLMGTPYYMSPEQCRGSGHVDHRSDIYSLGCVLYQMLTSRPPFVLEGSGEILAAHIHLDPVSPRTHVSSLPVSVESVVMELLAKDPNDRLQTMSEVIDALNSATTHGRGRDDSEPSLQASSTRMPAHADFDEQPSLGDRTTLAEHDSHSHKNFTAPTTLESSASESMATYTGGESHSSSWMMYTGLIVAAAAATFFLFSSILAQGASDATEPAMVSTQAAISPISAETPVIRSISEPMMMVSLVVESEPRGARVYRESDGVLLGETPFVVKLKRGPGSVTFLIKKRGYRSEAITMNIDRDDAFMVELKRVVENKRKWRHGHRANLRRSESNASSSESNASSSESNASSSESNASSSESNASSFESNASSSESNASSFESNATSTTANSAGALPGKDDAIDPFKSAR